MTLNYKESRQKKMNIQKLLNSTEINRDDVTFILSNRDALISEVSLLTNSKQKRNWEVLLGKKRIAILETWVKGIWLEDSQGDYFTGWASSIDVYDFTNNKVNLTNTVRIKREATPAEIEEAKQTHAFAIKYNIRGNTYDKIKEDCDRLYADKYEFISADDFLTSDKSLFKEVMGASIL